MSTQPPQGLQGRNSYIRALALWSLLVFLGLPALGKADGAPFLTPVQTGFIATPNGSGGYTFQTVSGPAGVFVYPLAINNGGQILMEDVESTPFLFSGGNYMPVNPPGIASPLVSGLNNRGQIVGTANPYVSPTAFVYNGSSVSTFAVPGFTFTAGYGINDSGTIVGAYGNANGEHGYILIPSATFTSYDVPGQTSTVFRGINSSGKVIGSIFPNGVEQAFVYDSKSGLELPLLVPGSASDSTLGINNVGEIVGQYGTSGGGTRGFVYLNGVFTTIDFPSGPNTLDDSTILTGVNDEGDIVGWASYDRVPEPSSLILLSIGGASYLFFTRKRER